MPGYFFKRFYFSGKFHKQFNIGEFAERFITTIFWGIIIQIVTYQIANKAFHLEEKNFLGYILSIYEKLSNPVRGKEDSNLPPMPFAQCLYYLGLSFFLSAGAGKLFHKIVRIFQIDIRSQVLRFSNDWHYILRGEEMQSIRDKEQMIIATEVDIMAQNLKGDSLLYSGVLKEYVVASNSDELEYITLAGAKHISPDGTKSIPIPGDTFIIPYAQIKNINLRFNKAKKPVFDLGQKKYPIVLLRAIQSAYAIVFFSIPFFIFYNKYSTGRLWACATVSILMCCAWLYFGVVAMYIQLSLKPNVYIINKRSINRSIFFTTCLVILVVAAGIFLYTKIERRQPLVHFTRWILLHSQSGS